MLKCVCSYINNTELGTITSHCENMLTIPGAQPVCSGNTSDIDVATKDQRRLRLSINCSVSYTGNAFPVLHWTKSDAENIAVNATTSGTVQGLFTNTSSITHELQANDSGVTFYCLITFQTPNTSPENAINGFAYTWNYTLCKQSTNDVKWSLWQSHRTFEYLN